MDDVERYVMDRSSVVRKDFRSPRGSVDVVAVPGVRRAFMYLLRRFGGAMGTDWVGEIIQQLVTWIVGASGVRDRRGATIIANDVAKLIAAFPNMNTETAIRIRVIMKARELASEMTRKRSLNRVALSADLADPHDDFAEVDRRLDGETGGR